MDNIRQEITKHRNILLLGFGIEGKSIYRFIRKILPNQTLTISDRSIDVQHDKLLENDPFIIFKLGDDYLDDLSAYDCIFKSPGICLKDHPDIAQNRALTSQTDLFLKYFHRQTIGITGTKGKSTVSSLIYHILQKTYEDVLLVGNIGVPAFDCLEKITPDTIVVFELSSQQLESVRNAPHISVLLNIYEEHLDYHVNYDDYRKAKFNIVKFQRDHDTVVFNQDNEIVNNFISTFSFPRQKIPFSIHQGLIDGFFIDHNQIYITEQGQSTLFYDGTDRKILLGNHNLSNMMVAARVCRLLLVSKDNIVAGFNDFKPLPHRLEYFGSYHGIDFYDDSISTIPESTVEALKAIKTVDTVILGGYDRGVNYTRLIDFLSHYPVRHVVLLGNVGERIHANLNTFSSNAMQCHVVNDYLEAVKIVFEVTRSQTACLLSPAAASYDHFKNFQERGTYFRKVVHQVSNRRKYDTFRRDYPIFTYENYKYEIVDSHLMIEYLFNVSDQFVFRPKLRIPFKLFYQYEDLSKNQYDNLIFHIGMVELISYWKATCSPTLRIKPHSLSERQIQWWKKLYFHGLGEFFYRNSIFDIHIDHFMNIETIGDNPLILHTYHLQADIMIPVGGGKDSIVSLELLKNHPGIKRPLIINPFESRLRVIEIAGYSRDELIEIERTTDPELLRLNRQGYLNGHTPFSGFIAFLTLLMGALTKSQYIVLSNESSANESTVRSSFINHQYSKSYEFEDDFRWYAKEYISSNLEYFSLLRPLNELQISQLFSYHKKYFPVFKSCNVGIREDRWCNNCAKCLFTFIILSPFITPTLLESIFGENLLDKVLFEIDYRQLIGETDHKPFECVGTSAEVKQASSLSLKYYSEQKPYLLDIFEQQHHHLDEGCDYLKDLWNDHHFLPDTFRRLIQNLISNVI